MDEKQMCAKIDAAVDELEQDLVEFLLQMIRIPTENPPGADYPRCARLIGEQMQELGMEVQYVDVPPERLAELAPHGQGLPRVSVIGTAAGEAEGPAAGTAAGAAAGPAAAPRPLIHFSGHYDVVPAGEGWSMDPYRGVVKDGRIYGRGASDMKSGIAAQIFAWAAQRRAGIRLAGTFRASATPDEETGGWAGLGYLVEKGHLNAGNTDYCVITECLDADKLCLGHRGSYWFEVQTRGRQCHGSMPSEGINAIDKMLDFYAAMNAQIRPQLGELSPQPIHPPQCRQSTLTLTMIEAGSKVNTVPPLCKASFDWRLIPEQSLEWAKRRIREVGDALKSADPDFDYSVRSIMEAEPTIVSRELPLVAAFRQAGRSCLGRELEYTVSPGSDDQRFVVHQGGLQQCIVYGPGPLAQAHKADEFVSVADLKNAARIMALGSLRLLGAA